MAKRLTTEEFKLKLHDDFVNEHREIAIRFLANIYPAENFSRMDSVVIVEHMVNLSNLYNDYKS